MNLIDLIGKGFFPKELPPPFTTEDFANKYSSMKSSLDGTIDWSTTSRCLDFSIAKVGLVRKLIKIPNPMHQAPLCEIISDNWEEINGILNSSKFSCSKPITDRGRAAVPPKFKKFIRKCFLGSYPYKYELKTDISKYYPSIYTHSIPWVIHEKEFAKANKHDKSLLGNKLDTYVQRTMYGQTKGIPIGPDTSLIIAELIGTKVDLLLKSEFPTIKGYRYVDDMYFFFQSLGDAEKCLLKLQEILKDYELSVNAEKTIIRKLPVGIEPDWIVKLRSFHIRETPITQYNDIISYFSLAFNLVQRSPKDFVLSYVVERIKYLKILSDENYSLLETMLLKTMLIEHSTIKEVFRVIYSNKRRANQYRIKRTILGFIEKNVNQGFDYELAWALWFVKSFEINVPKKLTKLLSNVKNSIPTLIILDLIKTGLIKREDYDSSYWLGEFNKDSLYNENWLIAYEMSIKKWVGSRFSYINDVPYFKILKKERVQFYNPDLQVELLNFEIEDPQNPDTDYQSTSIESRQETNPDIASENTSTEDIQEVDTYDTVEDKENSNPSNSNRVSPAVDIDDFDINDFNIDADDFDIDDVDIYDFDFLNY